MDLVMSSAYTNTFIFGFMLRALEFNGVYALGLGFNLQAPTLAFPKLLGLQGRVLSKNLGLGLYVTPGSVILASVGYSVYTETSDQGSTLRTHVFDHRL